MPIVMPSKNIFRKENQKVINNEISKISVEENSVELENKTLLEFSTNLFTEESASLLFWGYLKYSNNLSSLDVEGVNYSGVTQINGVYCAVFDINVTSSNYIYVPSIKVNLSLQYRRGESYEKTSSSRPAVYSNELLTDTQSVSVNDIVLGSDRFVLPSLSNVPAVYCRLVLINPTSQQSRSKSVSLRLFVPHDYNPVYTERSNGQDSIVFTSCGISVLADVVAFDTVESSYGSGDNVAEIYSNELFQKYDSENALNGISRGTYFNGSGGSVSAVKHLSEQIVEQYKNGKETATILCSISDYYTTEGDIAIDTKTGKMSFSIGDKVIPMVYGSDKVDKPMSQYKSGSAKVFRVVGLRFVYDGAVWQELTLQEV